MLLYFFHAPVEFFLNFHTFSLFLNFHTFSSFPLLLHQPPHSTTMFPYVCMVFLSVHMCDLCCFHHYIFYLLPVFIYTQHTHNRFTALLEFVWDHPGEQVPER